MGKRIVISKYSLSLTVKAHDPFWKDGGNFSDFLRIAIL